MKFFRPWKKKLMFNVVTFTALVTLFSCSTSSLSSSSLEMVHLLLRRVSKSSSRGQSKS